jgi:hypothetical protein
MIGDRAVSAGIFAGGMACLLLAGCSARGGKETAAPPQPPPPYPGYQAGRPTASATPPTPQEIERRTAALEEEKRNPRGAQARALAREIAAEKNRLVPAVAAYWEERERGARDPAAGGPNASPLPELPPISLYVRNGQLCEILPDKRLRPISDAELKEVWSRARQHVNAFKARMDRLTGGEW